MKKMAFLSLSLLALSTLGLASCGVKPSNVESENPDYKTYPSTRTDPAPNGGPALNLPNVRP